MYAPWREEQGMKLQLQSVCSTPPGAAAAAAVRSVWSLPLRAATPATLLLLLECKTKEHSVFQLELQATALGPGRAPGTSPAFSPPGLRGF